MMIPLNVLLTQIKAYAKTVEITLLAVLLLGTGIWIKVVYIQRNKARAQVAELQKTVDGYVAATKALQTRMDSASKALDVEDEENQKLLADLKKSIPSNPAEANAWAIAASKKIAEEAKR